MKALYLASILAVLFVGGVAIASDTVDSPDTENQNSIQESIELKGCKMPFGC